MAQPQSGINRCWQLLLILWLLSVVPLTTAWGVDCDYYRQKAQESRAAAQRERSITVQRDYHRQVAQAYENAAAQYDAKAASCGDSSGGYGAGVNAKEKAINNLVDQLGKTLSSSGQKAPDESDEEQLPVQESRRPARKKAPSASQRNERKEAETELQRLNDQLDKEVAAKPNPRLVDPDCSIAAWLVKDAQSHLQFMTGLNRLSRATTARSKPDERSASTLKTLQESVTKAATDYNSCLVSPAPDKGKGAASPSAAAATPSYLEFTGKGGEISVRNGQVGAARPSSVDPKIQEYFRERLKAVQDLYAPQPAISKSTVPPLYPPATVQLDEAEAKGFALTDPAFNQAIATLSSPFYLKEKKPTPVADQASVDSIDALLDADQDSNKESDSKKPAGNPRGWATEKVFGPVQRRFDSICGVDRVDTGNRELDLAYLKLQRDISPCTLLLKTFPFRGRRAVEGLQDYANDNTDNASMLLGATQGEQQ